MLIRYVATWIPSELIPLLKKCISQGLHNWIYVTNFTVFFLIDTCDKKCTKKNVV